MSGSSASSHLATAAFHAVVGAVARATLVGRPRSRVHPRRGHFTEADIGEILDQVWRFERGMPAHPDRDDDLRTRTSLRMAAFALAFRDTLLLREVERDYAIDLITEMGWKLGRWWLCPSPHSECLVAQYLREHDADDLCKNVPCPMRVPAAKA